MRLLVPKEIVEIIHEYQPSELYMNVAHYLQHALTDEKFSSEIQCQGIWARSMGPEPVFTNIMGYIVKKGDSCITQSLLHCQVQLSQSRLSHWYDERRCTGFIFVPRNEYGEWQTFNEPIENLIDTDAIWEEIHILTDDDLGSKLYDLDLEEYIEALALMITKRIENVLNEKTEMIFQYDDVRALTLDELWALFKEFKAF